MLGLAGVAPAPGPTAAPASVRPRVIAFFGDSATSAVYTPPGFPALVGKTTGATVRNLATISKTRNRATYSISQAASEELPRLPAKTTDAVVFLGTDDLERLAAGVPLSEIQEPYLRIVHALEARHVAVHLVTVRNFAYDARFVNKPKGSVAEWQSRLQRAADDLDNWIVSLDYPTLDIRSNADLMDEKSYVDGIHFNATGLEKMAQAVAQWFPAKPEPTPAPTPAGRRRAIAFFGDIATSEFYNKPGYPTFVGLTLNIPTHNLAVYSQARKSGSYYAINILQEQLPAVPADTTDAVLYIGPEDLRVIAIHQESVADIETSIMNILTGLKARGIRPYIITPRNYANDPQSSVPPGADRTQWQTNLKLAADQLADWEVSLGLPTLDVRKYPDLLSDAYYTDGTRFNTAGLHLIASYISRWFRQCDPTGKCVTARAI